MGALSYTAALCVLLYSCMYLLPKLRRRMLHVLGPRLGAGKEMLKAGNLRLERRLHPVGGVSRRPEVRLEALDAIDRDAPLLPRFVPRHAVLVDAPQVLVDLVPKPAQLPLQLCRPRLHRPHR